VERGLRCLKEGKKEETVHELHYSGEKGTFSFQALRERRKGLSV